VTDLRAAYRENWQGLAADAIHAGGGLDDPALARKGADALKWAYPTGREDGYVFYALAHLCIAFGRQSSLQRRSRLSAALLSVAQLVVDLLAQTAPPDGPERRYRPDLDG
jgi:hypothetical protein